MKIKKTFQNFGRNFGFSDSSKRGEGEKLISIIFYTLSYNNGRPEANFINLFSASFAYCIKF
jgi:hypothetical protein